MLALICLHLAIEILKIQVQFFYKVGIMLTQDSLQLPISDGQKLISSVAQTIQLEIKIKDALLG